MISFLPSMQRKLRRDGLHLFNIWYWDNVLSSIEQLGVLLAGSVREQRQLLNQLKFISNELRMPIVALGTSEALYAMQTDPQIASRLEPFFLAQVARSPEFRTFVVSFGRLLPLEKPTPLADKAIIQKLMGLSSGLTGKVTRPY